MQTYKELKDYFVVLYICTSIACPSHYRYKKWIIKYEDLPQFRPPTCGRLEDEIKMRITNKWSSIYKTAVSILGIDSNWCLIIRLKNAYLSFFIDIPCSMQYQHI
jgi:hypothetical protein